jgi:hypothetical protein
MIVHRFSENPFQYQNFEIWDVENMDAFFGGNKVIKEIFEKEYKLPLNEFKTRRSEIVETDLGIMAAILDVIGDKHFVLFTLHDKNHLELIQMQNSRVMNFGIDIESISPNHVYILIMDKLKEVSVGV